MADEPVKKGIDARIQERTESMLDKLNQKIQRTLEELRSDGGENGPGIEEEFEADAYPQGDMTEEEWELWWRTEVRARRKAGRPR